jgi:DNA ligase-1
VWEVLAADISHSKTHSTCHDQLKKIGHVKDGQTGGGLALRFPRFVRFRDDKSIHDATKESQMLEMYLDQTTQPQEKK